MLNMHGRGGGSGERHEMEAIRRGERRGRRKEREGGDG